MTNQKPTFTRADFVRQRRQKQQPEQTSAAVSRTSGRRARQAHSIYLPGVSRQASHSRTNVRARSYDLAFTLGQTQVRAPAIGLPTIDWSDRRLVSGFLTLVLLALLFVLWNASLFRVVSAEVIGHQRLGVQEINAVLGIIGEPIFKAVPEVMESNLRLAYPELESVQVQVAFPNRVRVTIAERTPVIAWYQNNALTWVDAQGFAFQPRGNVANLVQVMANGVPLQVPHDPTAPAYE
ncbi:MAG: FtsQ-type POTRA domain-containing protein, partial [Anaerolineales bacterium]|nr:FtsQ-type POTRA domain-containing protein [Anaerolineales bacterium]